MKGKCVHGTQMKMKTVLCNTLKGDFYNKIMIAKSRILFKDGKYSHGHIALVGVKRKKGLLTYHLVKLTGLHMGKGYQNPIQIR